MEEEEILKCSCFNSRRGSPEVNIPSQVQYCSEHISPSLFLGEESLGARRLASNEQNWQILVEEPATFLQTETRLLRGNS